MNRLLTIQGDKLPAGCEVMTFRGREAISHLFRYEVTVLVPASSAEDFESDQVLFEPITVSTHRDDGSVRSQWHGIIRSVEFVHALSDEVLYRIEMVPSLWALTLSRHSRVYVNKSVIDVLTKTFKLGELPASQWKDRTAAGYKPHEHVCQYNESDFDFASRWMEREGIYYYFDHEDSADTLVLMDAKAVPDARGEPVRFVPTAEGDRSTLEVMQQFSERRRASVSEIGLADRDPIRSADAKGKAPADDSGREKAVWYGQDDLRDSDAASKLAKVRAGRVRVASKVFAGRGRLFDVRAGYKTTLEDHPLAAMNVEYLVTEVRLFAHNEVGSRALERVLGVRGTASFSAEVSAIAADVGFVPERVTPWPMVHGVEVGMVDGAEDSDYAQIDDHGRYRVRIRFDEGTEKPDGQASTWIRMMQPHGGNPEGHHFPLRKKTEVLLVFLGGDPDRPVIAGAAPDSDSPSVITKANHTQNIIHTGGNNHFEIEDDDGKQYIDISSPPQTSFHHLGAHHGSSKHNTVLSTAGDGLIHTGGDHDITVGGKETDDVIGKVTEIYKNTQTTTVTAKVSELYDSNQTTNVSSLCKETFGTHTTAVDGHTFETVPIQLTKVNGALTEQHDSQTTAIDSIHFHKATDHTTDVTGEYKVQSPVLVINVASGGGVHDNTSMTITAPNLTGTAATVKWISAMDKIINAALHMKITVFYMVNSAVKIASNNLSMTLAASKIDVIQAGVAMYGLKIELGGSKGSNNVEKTEIGFNAKPTALEKELAALQSE